MRTISAKIAAGIPRSSVLINYLTNSISVCIELEYRSDISFNSILLCLYRTSILFYFVLSAI